jgi:hypothetical protein
MTRAGVGALVAIALTAGLALRLARLDVRPMHHDEANQAVKFGALVERGEYRYDAHDHHGPTLYYLTLPAAWLRGQPTLASLDERTSSARRPSCCCRCCRPASAARPWAPPPR